MKSPRLIILLYLLAATVGIFVAWDILRGCGGGEAEDMPAETPKEVISKQEIARKIQHLKTMPDHPASPGRKRTRQEVRNRIKHHAIAGNLEEMQSRQFETFRREAGMHDDDERQPSSQEMELMKTRGAVAW